MEPPTMTFRELETVVLLRDLPADGLRAGDLGAVVHVHSPTAVEVEFVRASGETQALVLLATDELRPAEDRDIMTTRSR